LPVRRQRHDLHCGPDFHNKAETSSFFSLIERYLEHHHGLQIAMETSNELDPDYNNEDKSSLPSGDRPPRLVTAEVLESVSLDKSHLGSDRVDADQERNLITGELSSFCSGVLYSFRYRRST
jgi:hypothetical protein